MLPARLKQRALQRWWDGPTVVPLMAGAARAIAVRPV